MGICAAHGDGPCTAGAMTVNRALMSCQVPGPQCRTGPQALQSDAPRRGGEGGDPLRPDMTHRSCPADELNPSGVSYPDDAINPFDSGCDADFSERISHVFAMIAPSS